MKKLIAISLCCLVLLAGCGKAPRPNIGTDAPATTEPVTEGPLDYADLPTSPAATPSTPATTEPVTEGSPDYADPPASPATTPSTPAVSEPVTPSPETPTQGNPGSVSTEPTSPSAPSVETTESTTEATEPSSVPATQPSKDADGFFNQVVRP